MSRRRSTYRSPEWPLRRQLAFIAAGTALASIIAAAQYLLMNGAPQ